MDTTRKSLALLLALASTVPAALAVAPAALAKGEDEVLKRDSCSEGVTWKLKAKPDVGGLEVEFEVDSNKAGQTWTIRVTDNGKQVFQGNRTTRRPSGSFSLERQIQDRRGRDAIVATATYADQTCTGRLTI